MDAVDAEVSLVAASAIEVSFSSNLGLASCFAGDGEGLFCVSAKETAAEDWEALWAIASSSRAAGLDKPLLDAPNSLPAGARSIKAGDSAKRSFGSVLSLVACLFCRVIAALDSCSLRGAAA